MNRDSAILQFFTSEIIKFRESLTAEKNENNTTIETYY